MFERCCRQQSPLFATRFTLQGSTSRLTSKGVTPSSLRVVAAFRGAPFASLNLGVPMRGGQPHEGDDAVLVGENRGILAKQLGLPAERFAHARQVHGSHVRSVLEPPGGEWADPSSEDLLEADGQATALLDIPVVALAADCLPVALISNEAVAMIHAGWRGLADGVLAEGVKSMRALGTHGPISAAIGPGAGGCCYEVSEEIHRVFSRYGPGVRRAKNLDLKRVAVLQLRALGVSEVHDVGICTICAADYLFFSHRRDAGCTGRHAGIAWRSS